MSTDRKLLKILGMVCSLAAFVLAVFFGFRMVNLFDSSTHSVWVYVAVVAALCGGIFLELFFMRCIRVANAPRMMLSGLPTTLLVAGVLVACVVVLATLFYEPAGADTVVGGSASVAGIVATTPAAFLLRRVREIAKR